MNRNKFIATIIRAGLFALLAFILFALGKKITTRKNCSACSGNGICRGEADCSLYLSGK
jgi:hypothetical protein